MATFKSTGSKPPKMQGKAVQKRNEREETRLNKSDGFAQKYRKRSRLLCTALVDLDSSTADEKVTAAHSGRHGFNR